MKKILLALMTAATVLFAGVVLADSHEDGDSGDKVAAPVEVFTCTYNEGKGPADLDAVAKQWNKWADSSGLDHYTAYTLTPYYMGPEQEFDFIWLGVSPTAALLGEAQDNWLATGGKVAQAFADMSSCTGHSNFATLQFKAPPERDDPSTLYISFSDCSISEGSNFGDIALGLDEWGRYREGHGSKAGMWVMFPAYGGGGEEFDFKFVTAHESLADQGADYDHYSKDGWKKADELFAGKLDCDSARVYQATNRRLADYDND